MRHSTENTLLRALLAQRRAGEHRVTLATLNTASFSPGVAQIPQNCTSQCLREISSLAVEMCAARLAAAAWRHAQVLLIQLNQAFPYLLVIHFHISCALFE